MRLARHSSTTRTTKERTAALALGPTHVHVDWIDEREGEFP